MSDLIAFYRSLAPDSEGRWISEVWAFSDDEMEWVHDFIQWLFPLREPSRFNSDAPLLTDADVAEFRTDPALREALGQSFTRFLAFLGLSMEEGCVVPGPDHSTKAEVWRVPNHNWLRITRVLACTRMLGLENESAAFFAYLEGVARPGASGIDPNTFAFWAGTQRI